MRYLITTVIFVASITATAAYAYCQCTTHCVGDYCTTTCIGSCR